MDTNKNIMSIYPFQDSFSSGEGNEAPFYIVELKSSTTSIEDRHDMNMSHNNSNLNQNLSIINFKLISQSKSNSSPVCVFYYRDPTDIKLTMIVSL